MNLQKNDIKRYILRRYSVDELESIFNQKLNNQSRNFKHYAHMSSNKFMVIVVSSITEEILVQLTDGWVEDSPIPEEGLYEFIQEIFGERIMKKYDELTNMNLQENIHRIKQMMGVNESQNDTYTLYHGTSSDWLNDIISKPTRLFLTTDEDVATYYSAKGGENYFMEKEIEFEIKYGETPDEYFNTEDNGEIEMFKSLYPKHATPIVIEFHIPKNKINNINNFIGYKGGELEVTPKYISKIHNIEWDNLDY